MCKLQNVIIMVERNLTELRCHDTMCSLFIVHCINVS